MKQQFLQSNQKLLKSRRKRAIDDAVTAKKQKLIKIKQLTKEEKDAAKAKVDEEATKAKNNIDQSTTNNDVDQAKTDGASAITKIQPDVVKKSEENAQMMMK